MLEEFISASRFPHTILTTEDLLNRFKWEKEMISIYCTKCGGLLYGSLINTTIHFCSCKHESKEVQFIPYQVCPKCNGQGIVTIPDHVVGNVSEWISDKSSYPCNVCNGAKIIPMFKITNK
jgi:hypothetical protein